MDCRAAQDVCAALSCYWDAACALELAASNNNGQKVVQAANANDHNGQEAVSLSTFSHVWRRVYGVLLEELPTDVDDHIAQDWAREARKIGHVRSQDWQMGRDPFEGAVFDMASTWCSSESATEHADFLSKLLDRIVRLGRAGPHVFKPTHEVSATGRRPIPCLEPDAIVCKLKHV